jgi:hypothetical protein
MCTRPFYEPPPTEKVKLRPKHVKFIRAAAKETLCTIRVHEFHATQFNVNNDIVGHWEVDSMPFNKRREVYTFTPIEKP